ncbi:MAG: response regulator [Chloroflexota bacterium]
MRLLLVDDHKVVRLGLAALFATVEEVQVVGEAGTMADALQETRTSQPDVVILDVRLPDGSGIDVCREIRSMRPETQVIMLTSHADEDAVVAAIMAGAAGYLLKQTEPERLIDAVRSAADGNSLLDPAVTRIVMERMQRLGAGGEIDPLAALSESERRVLPLIAEGKTNREIAAKLMFSEHTVKTYVSNILQKLNLSRRAEAAAFIAQQHRRPTSD